MTPEHEGLVLRGGLVIDGTGRAPFRADVAVAGGRIAALLSPGAPADGRAIDVEGRVVAPGFVDIHSHDDWIAALPDARRRDLLAVRLAQGITTEIVGNCGLGPFPATDATRPFLAGMNAFLMPDAAPDAWPDARAYLAHLEARGVDLNVGILAAHGPARLAAVGPAARPARPEERERVTAALDAALGAGAFGVSFGLIYPPGLYAPTDEVIEAVRPAASRGRIATFHQRSGSPELLERAIREIVDAGRRTGGHVHLSHEHVQGRRAWPLAADLVRWSEEAREAGIAYTQDVIPYTSVSTALFAVYPPWSLAAGPEGWIERARDPKDRERMRRDIETVAPTWPPWEPGRWATNIVRDVGYGSIRIAETASGRGDVTGRSIEEVARDRGVPPFDAMTDLLLEEEGRVTMRLGGISGDDREEGPLIGLLRHPGRAIVSDAWETGRGVPLPGAYGAFPRVFGRYVREMGVLSLAEAVRKVTRLPARIMGIEDRGRIAPGAWADLVVLDPDGVGERGTYDDPRRAPAGIERVFVNGVPVIERGAYVAPAPAGRVLRAG